MRSDVPRHEISNAISREFLLFIYGLDIPTSADVKVIDVGRTGLSRLFNVLLVEICGRTPKLST
jgi:hypothetical protein